MMEEKKVSHSVSSSSRHTARVSLYKRITHSLTIKKKLSLIWFINLGMVLFLTIGSAIFLGIMRSFSHDSPIWMQNSESFSALQTVCIVSLYLIYAPFALMIILFLIGTTGIHKMVFVHFFIWFCLFVVLVMLIAVSVTFGVLFAPWDGYIKAHVFG